MSKKSKINACLISAIIIISLPSLAILGINIINHIPRTIDNQEYISYSIKLQALSSPDWSFGSQEGRFILKKGSKAIYNFKNRILIACHLIGIYSLFLSTTPVDQEPFFI
jgi:hypothetical protein